MKNWKLTTSDPTIGQFIDGYWFLSKEPSDQTNDFPKLNPDPAAHVIIAGDDTTYLYQHDLLKHHGFGSHLIHPYRKTWQMDHRQPFQILGIKFNVGALYTLGVKTQINQVQAINQSEIKDVLPIDSIELLHQEQMSPQQLCHQLDRLLLPVFSKLKPDQHSLLVNKAIDLLAMGQASVSKLSDQLHRSKRTLERSFLRVTGLTLKQCQNMMRLESLLNHLYQLTEPINWAELAASFEFSDQPHLIRHLKTTLGSTPAVYAKQRDLAIDAYGNFELD